MIQAPPHKSMIGDLDGNVLTLVVYIAAIVMMWMPGVTYFSWALPLLVFLLEKRSPFVRFHALQALILMLTKITLIFVVSLIWGAIIATTLVTSGNLFGAAALLAIPIVRFLLSIAFTVFAIIACYQSYRYFEYEIPLLGKLTRNLGKI